MSMIVLIILVALAVGAVGTLLFGPLLLVAGIVILIVGVGWGRWFGRQAAGATRVSASPREMLTAPEPNELTASAERRAAEASRESAGAPGDAAGAPGDAESARRRAGTT